MKLKMCYATYFRGGDMKILAWILIALALMDIVPSTKHIASIIKSKNPNKKKILKDKYKLAIKATSAYIGNFLVIVYCLVNLYR